VEQTVRRELREGDKGVGGENLEPPVRGRDHADSPPAGTRNANPPPTVHRIELLRHHRAQIRHPRSWIDHRRARIRAGDGAPPSGLAAVATSTPRHATAPLCQVERQRAEGAEEGQRAEGNTRRVGEEEKGRRWEGDEAAVKKKRGEAAAVGKN
jgi:hypothetical protein